MVPRKQIGGNMENYKEIVEKLRSTKSESKRKLLDEAADTIERLEAERNELAIAALREQEERSKGCIHCSQESDIPLPTDMGFTWISGNELQNSYGECVIKFCPMCGRKLYISEDIKSSEYIKKDIEN
jgi:hypothetical protein